MEPVVLRGERVVLSTPVDTDVDAIYAACQDADIQRYTTVPSPYERRHAEQFVPKVAQGWADDSERTWAIRDGEALVGMIGLYRLGAGGAEIGYWMAPEARGRGLLTEAARLVVEWGFDSDGMALERIEWRAVVGNAASARAGQRLGFRYEGLLRLGLAGPHGRDDGWIAGLLGTDDRTPQPWPPLDDGVGAA